MNSWQFWDKQAEVPVWQDELNHIVEEYHRAIATEKNWRYALAALLDMAGGEIQIHEETILRLPPSAKISMWESPDGHKYTLKLVKE